MCDFAQFSSRDNVCSWAHRKHAATHSNTLQHVIQCCSIVCGMMSVCGLTVDTLQHTATRCNTLQHTLRDDECVWAYSKHAATHCNALQHTATRCNILNIVCGMMNARGLTKKTRCNTLQHAATRCNTLQHAATHCNIGCGTTSVPGLCCGW